MGSYVCYMYHGSLQLSIVIIIIVIIIIIIIIIIIYNLISRISKNQLLASRR